MYIQEKIINSSFKLANDLQETTNDSALIYHLLNFPFLEQTWCETQKIFLLQYKHL